MDNIAWIYGNAAATYIIAGMDRLACVWRVRLARIQFIVAIHMPGGAFLFFGTTQSHAFLVALVLYGFVRFPHRVHTWHFVCVMRFVGLSVFFLYSFIHIRTQTVHLYYAEHAIPPAVQRLFQRDE